MSTSKLSKVSIFSAAEEVSNVFDVGKVSRKDQIRVLKILAAQYGYTVVRTVPAGQATPQPKAEKKTKEVKPPKKSKFDGNPVFKENKRLKAAIKARRTKLGLKKGEKSSDPELLALLEQMKESIAELKALKAMAVQVD
jgi:transcriptional regulator GlxA family with amidase domain